jgi:uncharacterized damage-inducible protein DinB
MEIKSKFVGRREELGGKTRKLRFFVAPDLPAAGKLRQARAKRNSQDDRMSQVAVWYERKFEFAFPVELYPNICMRLRGTPARLEEVLRGAARDVLVRKPAAKWSAQEHVGHLLNLEPLWFARLQDFLGDGDTLTVTDLSNRKTDEANYNSREVAEILEGFRAARLRLVDRAAGVEPARFGRTLLHPRLKQPMRLVDHLYFVAEHDDHHLTKIWEMIRA